MMRRSVQSLHRGGRSRGYVLNDASMTQMNSSQGIKTLNRTGAVQFRGAKRLMGNNGGKQFDHAWPLLSHDDLGYSDHAADTHLIQLSSYMPKRNKGTAPWFRGADTYSPYYSEQGRFEYQRYLMISRFPSEYKKHFLKFLGGIQSAGAKRDTTIPQSAIHWLLRMIVDNFNPQHVHYVAAMEALLNHQEYDMARDVWRIMERQQTIPDDKCLISYLTLCAKAGEKTWALEAWNRYCSEKRFLQDNEADPKPVSRTPFSLTRDEVLYLPKWKKHFEHDPNLDVPDLNRFNTTRQIYHRMALTMLVTGEVQLFNQFFDILEESLLSTPTPVPEPPNPHLTTRPRWDPRESEDALQPTPWRMAESTHKSALLPAKASYEDMKPRFDTNDQFLIRCVSEVLEALVEKRPTLNGHPDLVKFADGLVDRLYKKLGDKKMGVLHTHRLFTAVLMVHRHIGNASGKVLHQKLQAMTDRRAKIAGVKETAHPLAYLEVLNAFADQGQVDEKTKRPPPGFDAKATMKDAAVVIRELSDPKFKFTADVHLAIVRVLANCGTMKANDYFVKNVLRTAEWGSEFLEALYVEYRRDKDVERWAELTKRALVWTARYNVECSEKFKRMVEDDFDIIGVQMRTMKELAVFQFRDVAEKRSARDPASQLQNPYTDYVSHALPFPDRDTGYPNEYGDLGQWRAPDRTNKSGAMAPGYYAPPMYGESQRNYHAEWRDPKNPKTPPLLPSPWDRRYKQYARGSHPSYNMTYAGPFPEIFPGRTKFRQPTRWDFQDVLKQSKYKINGPF